MSGFPSRWAPLVPELACSSLERSLAFYTQVIGASIAFAREGFAYLSIGDAQVMLEQMDGAWSTGPLEPPFGRGVNLQIEVDDAAAVARKLSDAGLAPFRPLAENWYRADMLEFGQLEVLVQDPDGYLLRFATPLGERLVEVPA